MKNRTFLEDLFQSIGFIAAIMVALSQYFLRSNFATLFAEKPEFFDISNIISIVLTFSIVLGIYTYRYNIDNKIYLNQKKKNRYWEQQRKQSEQATSQEKQIKIDEPWGFTAYHLAFVSVLVCIVTFAILLNTQNILVVAITYVVMICLAIFPLSVFAIKIYAVKELENRQERIYLVTLNKINAYFAGKVSIKVESTDRSNWMYPTRKMILEHNNKTYLVITDANNPDNYFDISEYGEVKTKDIKN